MKFKLLQNRTWYVAISLFCLIYTAYIVATILEKTYDTYKYNDYAYVEIKLDNSVKNTRYVDFKEGADTKNPSAMDFLYLPIYSGEANKKTFVEISKYNRILPCTVDGSDYCEYYQSDNYKKKMLEFFNIPIDLYVHDYFLEKENLSEIKATFSKFIKQEITNTFKSRFPWWKLLVGIIAIIATMLLLMKFRKHIFTFKYSSGLLFGLSSIFLEITKIHRIHKLDNEIVVIILGFIFSSLITKY